MSRSLFSRVTAPRRAGVLAASACAAGVVAAVAVPPDAQATPAPSGCSVATLHGTYLYAGNDASTISGTTETPMAFAGSEVYSGTGQVNGASTSSSGGTIHARSPYTGTYTVNADCTGTLTIGQKLNFDLYVAPSGDTFTYVETDPGSVSAVVETRVAPG